MFSDTFKDRRVWVSGHTGFKGSWLCEWLLSLGAEVYGYALEPAPHQPLFARLNLPQRMHHGVGDVRNAAAVAHSISQVQPEFVFHLAAQPLVRASYSQPIDTYTVNVMGTVHVLDALRALPRRCAAVMVTTDKCYENPERGEPFSESDPLGGRDPYSSSKGCAEIAIQSWRRSFLENGPVRVASARAGNVIGGGDWSPDRIVPDCVRALQSGTRISVRDPASVRPWEHVLEPLAGYLALAAALWTENGDRFASAYNFGPAAGANRTVRELVEEVLRHWPGRWEEVSSEGNVHEAKLLKLTTAKAWAQLGWSPVWDFASTVAHTVEWYRQAAAGGIPAELCLSQIRRYASDAAAKGMTWAR